MQETAIYYGVVAWLACWLVDLTIIIARGPVFIDPVVKFVIVLACLIIVLRGGMNHGWAWRQ